MIGRRCACTNSNSDERLVDMDAIELLTVCVEAYCIIVLKNFDDKVFLGARGNLQFAENAVAAENKLRGAISARI
jgi:hypothetical protein